MRVARHRLATLTVAMLAVASLGACASDDGATDAGAAETCPLTVVDPWVKATDTEMTGAFGVVENGSDAEVVVTGASSPQAGKMEIHEVVDKDGQMVMQPKEGGLVVPAGGSATLKPGSDHLMLMALTDPIQAGDEVEITVTCADGGSVTWTSVAKPFEGGEETYVPADGMHDMSASPSAS